MTTTKLEDRVYFYTLVRKELTPGNDAKATYTRHKGSMKGTSSFEVSGKLGERFATGNQFSIDGLTIRIGRADGVVATMWKETDRNNNPIYTDTRDEDYYQSDNWMTRHNETHTFGNTNKDKEPTFSFNSWLTSRYLYQNQWQSFFPTLHNMEERLK